MKKELTIFDRNRMHGAQEKRERKNLRNWVINNNKESLERVQNLLKELGEAKDEYL